MRYASQARPIIASKVVSAAMIAISLVTASVSLASGFAQKVALRSPAPAIDMMIIGARISANKYNKITYEAAAKDECVLCFHRELMKTNSRNNIQKAAQPYPAD